MLARALLSASAAAQAWYFFVLPLYPRWKGPPLGAGRWAGLLGFALAVGGAVLSARELKGKDRMRILGRGASAVLVALLALTVLSGIPAGWTPEAMRQASTGATVLAVLAMLA